MVEIRQLVHQVAVSQRCSIKKRFWKSSQNPQINTRSSHLEVLCQKRCSQNFAKLTDKHLCRSLFFNKVSGWKPKTFRGTHWRCSVKQGVFKNFANFTGKNLCWSFFFKKLHFWRPVTCFPVKFGNFLRTTISRNICECLFLNVI